MNFGGKLKAVTFSYDDGVTQDERLIMLFDALLLSSTAAAISASRAALSSATSAM